MTTLSNYVDLSDYGVNLSENYVYWLEKYVDLPDIDK